MELESLLDRSELRRLQRAAKEKDMVKIIEWAMQFEKTIQDSYNKLCQKELEKQVKTAIERYMIVIIYTLHFNEKLQFDEKTIEDFMKDVKATIKLFENEEYSLEEYKQMLKDDNILYFERDD